MPLEAKILQIWPKHDHSMAHTWPPLNPNKSTSKQNFYLAYMTLQKIFSNNNHLEARILKNSKNMNKLPKHGHIITSTWPLYGSNRWEYSILHASSNENLIHFMHLRAKII